MIKRLIRWGLLTAGGMVAAAEVMAATSIASTNPALTSQPAQDFRSLVGTSADIAPSAYQYRADRAARDNPPESCLALMWYAHQAMNQPVDVNSLAIKQVLCGLLWEEIRPVQRLELTWSADLKRRPAPDEVVITILQNKGSSSSWWNNLEAVPKLVKPTLSGDGRSYLYEMPTDTCGIVVSVAGARIASAFEVPAVKVLVADLWKKMDLEIEWGFDPATLDKDYSGRIETYDGRVGGLSPLKEDVTTTATESSSWRSVGKGPARRGLKASLLYIGTAKWRRVQPFTSQPDDVARTIVTLWTKAGNFSFLAADLENGWQYQAGLERTANLHLAGDDVPCFLRSFLNGYAVDILPDQGYVFNEHAVHGPPDKIFEEAAFLERLRGLLVREDGPSLWLARATPRVWLEQGQKISVKNAPTHFGNVAFEITSDVDHGRISATVNLPSRHPPKEVWLRLRHPKAIPIRGVKVNDQYYPDFDQAREAVKLHDLAGDVSVEVRY